MNFYLKKKLKGKQELKELSQELEFVQRQNAEALNEKLALEDARKKLQHLTNEEHSQASVALSNLSTAQIQLEQITKEIEYKKEMYSSVQQEKVTNHVLFSDTQIRLTNRIKHQALTPDSSIYEKQKQELTKELSKQKEKTSGTRDTTRLNEAQIERLKLKLKKLRTAVERMKNKKDRELRGQELLRKTIEKRQDGVSADDDEIFDLDDDPELQQLIDEAIDATSRRPSLPLSASLIV